MECLGLDLRTMDCFVVVWSSCGSGAGDGGYRGEDSGVLH